MRHVDSRVLIMLRHLQKFHEPKQASQIISPHDCDPIVAGCILRQAHKLGYVSTEKIGGSHSLYWSITPQGREAAK